MAQNDTIITFKNVSKTYILYKNDQARFKALFFKPRNPKTNRALNNVSFEIRRGESVGIVGDNGAGKSTLLKMITGVAFPDEGDIVVNGKVAALLELTAGFSLEMTGRENIYLKGYILGLEDDYIKQIEENIIDFAELGDYIDQPVRTYSSGMKMRLGFAINVNIASKRSARKRSRRSSAPAPRCSMSATAPIPSARSVRAPSICERAP